MTIEEATNVTLEDAIKCFEHTIFPQDFSPYTLRAKAINELVLAALRTQLQENKPLTLEELREMSGEPVWIVEQPDWGHWELSADAEDYLADRDQDFYGLKHDDPAGRYGLHVLGWLAYRRPPEGEA